jgi:DNA adenine methylase
MTNKPLKIPFSYFGGKRSVAPIIWQGLGQVSNYVEPFAGSLAVLLSNPSVPKIETINDIDCFLSNFWRAVSQDPEGVVKFADYPVNETDLHARHRWLVSAATQDFHQQMNEDPDYYDVKIAGWWVYGQCASITGNWLRPKGLNALPLLSSAGGGIHGLTYSIPDQFKKLQQRLRRVRVSCGDWKRIISPSITYNSKGLTAKEMTGVFLDPPYDAQNRDQVYREDNNIYQEVCRWAIANGDNSRMRVVVCGYKDDVVFPETWQHYSWNSNGGMANLGDDRGKQNAKREMIYFSPHCLEIK